MAKRSYYVNATNEEGTSGERPEIEASSQQEAIKIYRELYGDRFPVVTATLKKNIDADPEQETKESNPVNVDLPAEEDSAKVE
jgi:hypothetical protein